MLDEHDVHVWRVALHERAVLDRALSADERARGERFRFETDRTRWKSARSWLRHTLSRYLDISPHEISFSSGDRDKPALSPELGADWLRFNLSHSGAVALIAVSADDEVGVDVEVVSDRIDGRDLLGVARRVLDDDVVLALEQAEQTEQRARFYRAWVRHEARGKCEGAGITEPGQPPIAAHVFDLDVGAGYAAALATERRPASVHLWETV